MNHSCNFSSSSHSRAMKHYTLEIERMNTQNGSPWKSQPPLKHVSFLFISTFVIICDAVDGSFEIRREKSVTGW